MKVKYIILLSLLLLFGSCNEEGDMTVTPTVPEYDLSDSETDLIQKERYKLYQDFQIILIDDVEPSDYKYTLTGSSPIRITKSVLDTAGKLKAIKLVREILYDAFPEHHIKRMPVKCILGNQVFEEYTTPDGLNQTKLYSYLGEAYFAFGITNNVLNKKETQEEFVNSVLSEFIIKGVLEKNYGEDYLDLFSSMFFSAQEERSGIYYSYGDMNPGTIPGTDLELQPADFPYEDFFKIPDMQEFAYENGVPYLNVEDSKSQYWQKPEKIVRLKSKDFLPAFLTWAFTTSDMEKQRVFTTHLVFEKRFRIIQGLIKEYVDLDL